MLEKLDPLLHSELRLGVMSLLMKYEEAEFVYLKEQTKATAGNLSVQLEKLDKADYLTIDKGYKGKRPVTRCRITKTGQEAFERYVNALQSYLKPTKKGA